MLTVPCRLRDARSKIEAGEPVDWQQVVLLQDLDIAILDREYVEDSIKQQEEADDDLERFVLG